MSRTAIIILVAVVILGLLLCCCLGTVALLSARGYSGGGWLSSLGSWGPGLREESRGFTQEFRVDLPATLVVDNEVGQVTVRPGDVGVVTVETRYRARAGTTGAATRLLDSVGYETDASSDRVEIRVDLPSSMVNAVVSVDLDITVPRETSVEVRNNVGEMQVTGVVGTLHLRGDVGEVRVRDVTLTGPSEVQASVGEVDFAGILPESGEVRITSQVGSVRVTLPAESQFFLDASTGVGDIDCDFELQDREEDDNRGPASELRGRVGVNPAVSLYLRAGTGEVSLRPD